MINYDVSEYNRLNSDLYRREKRNLQIEFLKLQNWAIKEGVVVHLLAPSLAPVKDHKDNIIVADGMQMA